jgi:hypothetical protein
VSIFGSILSKLGIGDDADKPATPATPATPTPNAAPPATAAPVAPAEPVVYKSNAIPVVDVMSKLEGMAAKHPEKLNWKTSIVDLHKLLGLDHSLQARKELAVELGCPTEKLKDSAEMNMWLHKAVLIKIAGNGGNIPADMLD